MIRLKKGGGVSESSKTWGGQIVVPPVVQIYCSGTPFSPPPQFQVLEEGSGKLKQSFCSQKGKYQDGDSPPRSGMGIFDSSPSKRPLKTVTSYSSTWAHPRQALSSRHCPLQRKRGERITGFIFFVQTSLQQGLQDNLIISLA